MVKMHMIFTVFKYVLKHQSGGGVETKRQNFVLKWL